MATTHVDQNHFQSKLCLAIQLSCVTVLHSFDLFSVKEQDAVCNSDAPLLPNTINKRLNKFSFSKLSLLIEGSECTSRSLIVS